MAEKQIVVTDCDRCAGRKKPATRTIKYSVDGEDFEVDVCEDHGHAFDRDIGVWLRISREVVRSNSFGPAKLLITTAREQEEQEARRQKSSVFIPQELPPGKVHIQKLPPGYHTWSLSEHAKQRCGERGISERDALITASDPQYCTPHREADADAEGRWIYRRGPVAVVVDKPTRTVITVLNRDSEEMEGVMTG